jgi:hypothetical protein
VLACPECGFEWSGSAQATVAEISSAPTGYHQLFDARTEPTDRSCRQRPAPAVWSAIEYLAHTADAVAWYHTRIAKVLTEDHARLEPFDWDAACGQRRYRDRDVADTVKDLDRTCSGLACQLEALGPASWARTGIGSSDGGRRSVLALSRRAAHELRHHQHDIERSLG